MRKAKVTLALALLSICALLPNLLVYADDYVGPIRVVTSPPIAFYDYSKPLPDGRVKVCWIMDFIWYVEGEEVGVARQYVTGFIDVNQIADLFGFGVVTSTVDGLEGRLGYSIANKWDMNTNEIWDFSMRVFGGTGDFRGIKGTVEADYPDFLLYLNFNPWE